MSKFIKAFIFLAVSFVCATASFGAGRYYSKNNVIKLVTRANITLSRVDVRSCNKEIAKYKKYAVRSGDSIYSIAKKFLVLEWQLRKANKFNKSTVLHPGQKIIVPIINWKSKSYIGNASWYGPGFHGKKMANGQIYDQNSVLVAHRTLPLGLELKITNLKNGKYIIARVLDRGPYTKVNGRYAREIDLSKGAARLLGTIKSGVVPVLIEPI